MSNVDPERNYPIGEASRIIGRDRKTLRRWIKMYPNKFGVTFNAFNQRIQISGEVLSKIIKNQFILD